MLHPTPSVAATERTGHAVRRFASQGIRPMRDYPWLHEYCLNRFGSPQALQARLPVPLSAEALRAVPDVRSLPLFSLRLFRAGLKQSLVAAQWPALGEAFFGFVPELWGP